MKITATLVSALAAVAAARKSEVLSKDEHAALGVEWMGNATSPSSHDALPELDSYPEEFTWQQGRRQLLRPQSAHTSILRKLWAHGSVSAR